MRAALPIVALALGGCLNIIGGSNGSECETNLDCPREFRCDREAARCVETDEAPDMALEADFAVPDAAAQPRPDAAVPDMAPDAAPDAAPDMAPDSAPDMAPNEEGPFGVAADCFAGESANTEVRLDGRSTHVPRALCTSHVVAWTEEIDGEVRLRYRDGADGEPQTGPALVPDTRVVAARDVVLLSVPNPGFGVANVHRWSPGDAETTALQQRNAWQGQPVRIPGLSAFVERGDTVRHVRLHFDDAFEGDVDCIRGGRHQWGVTLGDHFVAFFERSSGSRRTDLVVTHGWRCDGESRVVLPLPGRIPEDARLAVGDHGLFWIAEDPHTRLRALWTVDRADLVAGPMLAELPTIDTINPVDVAARGDWLAVVSYRPGGYRLDLFDLDGNAQKLLPNSSANALDPSFGESYLMWAEQAAAQPWEVRFARLGDL